jgi:hypothetical protein
MSLIELIERERERHSLQGYKLKRVQASTINEKDSQIVIDKYNCEVYFNSKYKDDFVVTVWNK